MDVQVVQRKLGAPPTGYMDFETIRRVKGVQASIGHERTGEVDAATAEALGEEARVGMVPVWFIRDMALGHCGDDIAELRKVLQLGRSCCFDDGVEQAVRRHQSAHRLPLTGVVDRATVLTLR